MKSTTSILAPHTGRRETTLFIGFTTESIAQVIHDSTNTADGRQDRCGGAFSDAWQHFALCQYSKILRKMKQAGIFFHRPDKLPGSKDGKVHERDMTSGPDSWETTAVPSAEKYCLADSVSSRPGCCQPHADILPVSCLPASFVLPRHEPYTPPGWPDPHPMYGTFFWPLA